MPSFAGTWNTARYVADNPETTESIQLTIAEDANPGNGNLEGTAIFFISADGNTIHGAWTSNVHNNGPQPWFGTRII
jgi:hypothetical protein